MTTTTEQPTTLAKSFTLELVGTQHDGYTMWSVYCESRLATIDGQPPMIVNTYTTDLHKAIGEALEDAELWVMCQKL